MASVQVPISDKVVPRFTHCWVYESMVDIMIYRTGSWARYKQSKKVFTKLNSTNIYISLSVCVLYKSQCPWATPRRNNWKSLPHLLQLDRFGPVLVRLSLAGEMPPKMAGFLMGRSCENHGKNPVKITTPNMEVYSWTNY